MNLPPASPNFQETSTPHPHANLTHTGRLWVVMAQLAPVLQQQTGNLGGRGDWGWNPADLPTGCELEKPQEVLSARLPTPPYLGPGARG